MKNKTEKLYSFSGDATHEDSLDGLEQYIVLSNDAPDDIVAETLEDSGDAIIYRAERAEMDSLYESIEMNVDRNSLGNGHILDLLEPYIICKF
jgi:hypothetical protein